LAKPKSADSLANQFVFTGGEIKKNLERIFRAGQRSLGFPVMLHRLSIWVTNNWWLINPATQAIEVFA
jgi:hypothetical protein